MARGTRYMAVDSFPGLVRARNFEKKKGRRLVRAARLPFLLAPVGVVRGVRGGSRTLPGLFQSRDPRQHCRARERLHVAQLLALLHSLRFRCHVVSLLCLGLPTGASLVRDCARKIPVDAADDGMGVTLIMRDLWHSGYQNRGSRAAME